MSHSSNNQILVASTSQALTVLREAAYGQHILLIYEDIGTLREVYCDYALEKLNKNKEAMLVVPYLETAIATKTHLEEKGILVNEQQKEGAFAVIDAERWFFATEINEDEMMARLFEDIRRYGRQGATIFRDIGVFFYRAQEAQLIGLETAASSKINKNCKIICCIHRSDFERLIPAHRNLLVSSHDKALGITGTQNVVFEEALAQSVNEAMSIYGQQISQVLKAYLERQYSIPPESLAENPRALVEALESILDSGSRLVERKILRSLYSKIGSPVPQSSAIAFEERISEVKKIYSEYYK
jgi:hypothetical protein